MATFSYECPQGHQFDQFNSSHRDPNPACPECGSATRRLIAGPPAYKLKGSGWSHDGYSVTERGMQAESDAGDREGDKRRMKGGKDFS